MLYNIVKLQCYNRFFTDKRTRTALCICGVQATAAITLLGVLATNALLVVQDAVQHHYHVHAGLVTSAFSESSRVLTGSSAALFIVCTLATHKRKTYNYCQRCQHQHKAAVTRGFTDFSSALIACTDTLSIKLPLSYSSRPSRVRLPEPPTALKLRNVSWTCTHSGP